MKALILTVAGMSSRFGRSLGRPCLKCLYFERSVTEALLYQALNRDGDFDLYIIVGGYKFEELTDFVRENFNPKSDKIVLLRNPYYEKYGSGYSLYVGLRYAISLHCDEVVFAEGDLWVDRESFLMLSSSKSDAVSYNHEVIESDKSVVFYFDKARQIHYLYDVTHEILEIKEPFISIYNSGQIWKFSSFERLKSTVEEMKLSDWQGTNLIFIQKYFEKTKEFGLFEIKEWINCNEVGDFKKMEGKLYE